VSSPDTPAATSPVQRAVTQKSMGSAAHPAPDPDAPPAFDINAWTPGKVHTVHSPQEFKAFVLERSGERPVVLMCKAQGCRPCKVFSRTYVRWAEANPEIICLDVIGDESKALRRMMILLDVKMTPSFFAYRYSDQIEAHSGNSDEKLEHMMAVAAATMRPGGGGRGGGGGAAGGDAGAASVSGAGAEGDGADAGAASSASVATGAEAEGEGTTGQGPGSAGRETRQSGGQEAG
jgi:hypothetical protein